MMLPFADATIRSFRGLRDLELADFGTINLFVGPNNVGKTSVLEALSIAARPLERHAWLRVAAERDPFGASARDSVRRLRDLFPTDATTDRPAGARARIELAMAGSLPLRSVRAECKILRGSGDAHPPGSAHPPSPAAGKVGVRLEVEATPDSDPQAPVRDAFDWWEGEPPAQAQPPTASTHASVVRPYDDGATAPLVGHVVAIRREERADSLVELLSQVDPRVASIEVRSQSSARPSGGSTVFIRDADGNAFPLEALGRGVRRALWMSLAVSTARNGVLFIDEIESALHMSAIGRVFRWIVEACARNKVQMFATTRSLEAVDALLGAQDAPACAAVVGYRLAVPGPGLAVTAERYGEDLLRRLRAERGLEVR